MASNPMQRQARNSFLLGMLVTLLIAGAIIAFLFIQLQNSQKQLKAAKASVKRVMVLSQDVKSGDILTTDMFNEVETKSASIPSNYVVMSDLLDAYSFYTKDGVRILQRYENGEQNLYLNDNEDEKKQTKVEFEEETGRYYTGKDASKQYIETAVAPVVAKVDISQNTIVTQGMIARSDEIPTDDMRKQEYNSIVLPIDLVTDDYVDIRLMMPSGQDYIVISKKRVTIPIVDGIYLSDTVQMNLKEDEILALSSAIVEAYMLQGSKLYATKYTEAGSQEASTPTYVPNSETLQLLDSDTNVLAKAKAVLSARYNANDRALKNLRENDINSALETYGDKDQITTNMEESTTSTQESRQQYLQTLTP